MKRRLPVSVFLPVAFGMSSSLVGAQPMPDTARALKTLMEGSSSYANGQMGSASAAAQAAAKTAGISHTVRPGETLARVVHQVYGSHPYKDAPVFRLIAQRNPDAFLGGNPNRLRAGAHLVLPHPADLHAALAAQHPQFQSAGSGPVAAGTTTSAGQGAQPAQASAGSSPAHDARRGWVRFP